jgi:TRAP-type C4-dicarboxylate transport system permease small subunit
MRRLLQASENLAALFLLLIALLVTVNVTIRYVLAYQIPDWFDFSRQMQAIAIFWGIAIATYRGGHICVDVLWEHLGRPGQRWLDLLATVVAFLFLVPMAWMIWVKVRSTGTQATSDLRIPLVYFYVVSAAGATVAVILAGLRVWDLWRGRGVGAGEDEVQHGP